ncbi:MAG TPA: FAD/NAD(P)-binding protein [Anaerolineales bacterium]|nr:FAD/NAD(P)-binding protein [Anaerolineales bacterium]
MANKNSQAGLPYQVAVVGSGASGTLVAAQFKKLASQERLALIGNASRPARGVAYETPYHSNLLNVTAGNMSAFPDDKNHFVNWLESRIPESNADTFAPRVIYGEYLASIFDETFDGASNVEYIYGTVVNLSRPKDFWTVHLENGDSLNAYNVVLALGNLLPPGNPIDLSAVKSIYWRNPWALDVARGLPSDAPVLLIGTGLTMVDVALSLREAGHGGPIHAISRHGRLYHSHRPYQARPLAELPEGFESPVGALRWIRNQVKLAERMGSDWRAVIDSLRPYTAQIWSGWSLNQRASFLRHARNLWDIHRHRMAPEISDQLSALLEDCILTIHRGRLVSVVQKEQNAEVVWKDASNELHTLTVARIVNCTGPSRDYSQIQSPLIACLCEAGWLVPDALRLGFETDSEGHLIAANGESVQGLFTLGPLRIAELWESIAIPEIRNQALALAELLVSEAMSARVAT